MNRIQTAEDFKKEGIRDNGVRQQQHEHQQEIIDQRAECVESLGGKGLGNQGKDTVRCERHDDPD